VLILDQWLLSVTSLTTENGADTMTASDYFLVHTFKDQRHQPPYRCIVANPDGDWPDFEWSGTKRRANCVTGVWGYSDFLEDTGVNLAEDLDASETEWDVDDASGIEVGWILEVGSEQVFCSARDTDNNKITVVRGLHGTTAETHSNTDSISRYVPPDDIEMLCGILTARLYHRGTAGWSDIIGSKDSAQQFVKAIAPEAAYIIDLYEEELWDADSRAIDWGTDLLGRSGVY
jgi:hypothetical protein